ncbi:hypothetical protein DUNSADRAFT_17382 [Dunaliella salina]|uniref:Uncharacterized protein n=1 Tax=Dunaliella salina TaxID=3046 RepID=A0ABQ7G1V4_DUNSA|nr:hypothetical protein DUNSADRAFT_17382 [Dunaliella salina]|eukprot:KAF5828585.1 hypothetical protein DUNSADRAFT_17382 [Dunaliella salina]
MTCSTARLTRGASPTSTLHLLLGQPSLWLLARARRINELISGYVMQIFSHD